MYGKRKPFLFLPLDFRVLLMWPFCFACPEQRSILNWIWPMVIATFRRGPWTDFGLSAWKRVGKRKTLLNNLRQSISELKSIVDWKYETQYSYPKFSELGLCAGCENPSIPIILLETQLENRSWRSHRNAVENATKAKTQFSGWITTTAAARTWP